MADGLLDLPGASALLDSAASAGLDLREALAGDDDALRPTEIAQPALLFASAMLAGALPESVDIVGVAGHSVGEYAALVSVGALDAGAAMGLVVERGRAMAAMHQGTMVALLGTSEEVAEEVCAAVERAGSGPVVVANVNAPGQVVLSGTRKGVDAAVALARERGVRKAMPLNVSGAFHSPLMAEAADRVGALIDSATFAPARVPVACNVDGSAVSDPEGLRDRLRRQLVSPVRWVDCVTTLRGLGAEVVVELGPGSVLSGLARRIAPEVRTLSIAQVSDAASLGERLEAVVHG